MIQVDHGSVLFPLPAKRFGRGGEDPETIARTSTWNSNSTLACCLKGWKSKFAPGKYKVYITYSRTVGSEYGQSLKIVP
jgi:hypothetical protein